MFRSIAWSCTLGLLVACGAATEPSVTDGYVAPGSDAAAGGNVNVGSAVAAGGSAEAPPATETSRPEVDSGTVGLGGSSVAQSLGASVDGGRMGERGSAVTRTTAAGAGGAKLETGGASGIGGAKAGGGAKAAGGAANLGGAVSAGGSAGTAEVGGTPSVGGALGTGGANGVGGAHAGGSPGVGGIASAGGSAAAAFDAGPALLWSDQCRQFTSQDELRTAPGAPWICVHLIYGKWSGVVLCPNVRDLSQRCNDNAVPGCPDFGAECEATSCPSFAFGGC